MKLQQLRYIVEVFGRSLNVSAAAKALGTSQPSLSKQIRQLEEELGVQIFERHGKHFTQVTPAGKELLRLAGEMLAKSDDIKAVACEFTHPEQGMLTIAAASNQLRYQMPSMLCGFVGRYPQVVIQVHQSRPPQIAEAITRGEVDLALGVAETGGIYDDLLMLPCYHHQMMVVARRDHPLVLKKQISTEELANYPLVSLPLDFWGQSVMRALFNYSELASRIVLTATDPELLKSYVRLGLGVGVIAKMAIHPQVDSDLVSFDTTSFLPIFTTKIGFLRGKFMRNYMLDFITHFAPHLTRTVIKAAAALKDNRAVDEMFKSFKLPIK